MYSDRRYSLTRYSANREENTLAIAEWFAESMGAVAGAAVPVRFRERYALAVQGSACATVSLISRLSASGSLCASARLSADVITRSAPHAALCARAYAQKNLPVRAAYSETVFHQIQAGKNIPYAIVLGESLERTVDGSKYLPARLTAGEVCTTLSAATSQTTQRAIFQLTIPPGGELRINSELFSVLLNGENALHTQSGDWIDISPALLRVVIESASGGGLTGQLIYTERYL